MYKGNVLGFRRTLRLIHLNFFVRAAVSGFVCTPVSSRKSTQMLVHEAPGVAIGYLVIGYRVSSFKSL